MRADLHKFLFVIDNLSTGGAQRQMINLALGLSRRGYKIEIFCYAEGDLLAQPLAAANIPVHWYIKRGRFTPDVILALSQLIHKGKFDLALSFLTTPNFYAIAAGRLLQLRKVPVVVSERFGDLPGGVPRTEKFARQFYRFASHVVTNSHHQRISLARTYPWLKDRLTTIYNGYDLQKFSPQTALVNNQPIRIVTIASVSPYKNGMCLVEALNILKNRDHLTPDVDWIGQLVMMGDRLQYLNEMKQAIQKYGLENQWHWLNQRLDIVDQLHEHDVLVHPSFMEGLPNVVCEALSCARPVIVSNTLDHANLVQDGESGFLFDYHDPTDLADKIKTFISLAPEKRLLMGQQGRKYAESNLTQHLLVDHYEKLFISLLK